MSPHFRTTALKRLLYMKKIIKVKKVNVKTFTVNMALLKIQHKGHKIGPHKVYFQKKNLKACFQIKMNSLYMMKILV